jgi:hypothetical protein
VRDQVSHPYKTTGKIILLYIIYVSENFTNFSKVNVYQLCSKNVMAVPSFTLLFGIVTVPMRYST